MHVASLGMGKSAGIVGVDFDWIEPDRRATFHEIGVSAICVGIGYIRVMVNRPVEIRDCHVDPAFQNISEAADICGLMRSRG
jgi:hypothetical protein